MSEDIPTSEELIIRQQDLVENPEPRVPVCLLLDASSSMLTKGKNGTSRLDELNAALSQFMSEILGDPNARKSAEVCIIAFSADARILRDFSLVTPEDSSLMLADVGSVTSLGTGLGVAMELLERRKDEYRNAGVEYWQPWLVVITDGAPTDDLHLAYIDQITKLVQDRKLSVFPIAVGELPDLTALNAISPVRPPMRLKGTHFRELFEWLSKSVARVSSSIPGERVPLDAKGIAAWSQV